MTRDEFTAIARVAEFRPEAPLTLRDWADVVAAIPLLWDQGGPMDVAADEALVQCQERIRMVTAWLTPWLRTTDRLPAELDCGWGRWLANL